MEALTSSETLVTTRRGIPGDQIPKQLLPSRKMSVQSVYRVCPQVLSPKLVTAFRLKKV
jgi:hypothetical protein